MRAIAASIDPIDFRNPGCGYEVRITDEYGGRLLDTRRDPATGAELLTFEDGVRVVNYYLDTRKA